MSALIRNLNENPAADPTADTGDEYITAILGPSPESHPVAGAVRTNPQYVYLFKRVEKGLAAGKSPDELREDLIRENESLGPNPLEEFAVEEILLYTLYLFRKQAQRPDLFSQWERISLADARKDKDHGVPWVVKGLLAEESANLVAALPHSMKSLTWLGAAMEAVYTHKVWGHFDAQGVKRTLFVESEDPPWLLKARIRGLAKGMGLKAAEELPGFRVIWTGPFDLVNGGADQLRRVIEEHQPDFVVVSTLQNLLGGRNWKEANEMQPVNAAFMQLARISPLVVLTHSPWDTKQKRAAGSVTQTANYLFATHYEKIPPNRVAVRVDSKIGSGDEEFILRLDTEGDPDDPSAVRNVVYDRAGRPRGSKKQEIQEAIANNPEASTKQLAEALDIPERTVRWVIQQQKESKKARPIPLRHRRKGRR